MSKARVTAERTTRMQFSARSIKPLSRLAEYRISSSGRYCISRIDSGYGRCGALPGTGRTRPTPCSGQHARLPDPRKHRQHAGLHRCAAGDNARGDIGRIKSGRACCFRRRRSCCSILKIWTRIPARSTRRWSNVDIETGAGGIRRPRAFWFRNCPAWLPLFLHGFPAGLGLRRHLYGRQRGPATCAFFGGRYGIVTEKPSPAWAVHGDRPRPSVEERGDPRARGGAS